jgi:D-alanine-D-alanine ligase-like ATP-grasp enzyme
MIQPAMRRIVVATMKTAVDSVHHRKGSFEMYGCDFMIDDTYGMWLIEVNASPSMEHSTPITARLCQAVLEDLCKVRLSHQTPDAGGLCEPW